MKSHKSKRTFIVTYDFENNDKLGSGSIYINTSGQGEDFAAYEAYKSAKQKLSSVVIVNVLEVHPSIYKKFATFRRNAL